MAIIFFRLGNEIAIPLLVFGERPVEKFLNTAHKLIQELHTTIIVFKEKIFDEEGYLKLPNLNFAKWTFSLNHFSSETIALKCLANPTL
jgi:hypothetical protein